MNTAFAAGALCVVIALCGGYYYAKESASLHSIERRELKTIARLKIDQLAQWHREKTGDARVISQSPYFSRGVEEWLQHRADTSRRSLLSKGLLLYQTQFGFQNIILTSAAGDVLLSLDPALEALDPVTIRNITAVIGGSNETRSDCYVCPTHQRIHFDITAPVRNMKGRIVAVLIFRADPVGSLFPLIESMPTRGKTTETEIVQPDGDSVLFLNDQRFRKHSGPFLRIPLTDLNSVAARAVHGVKGTFEGVDYRGVEVIAYIAPVPETRWMLITKVDHRELSEQLYYRAGAAGGITLILILLIGSAVAFFYRSREKNIYQKLFEKEKQLRASEEKYKKAFMTSPDSININRMADGADVSINDGFTRNMGYEEADVLGKTSAELNIWDDPRDRDTLVAGLAADGSVQNLVAQFCGRDGKKISGMMSASIIELDGIDHILSITRDITGLTQAEAALRESEEKYRGLVENSSDAIVMYVDGKIVFVNNECVRMIGAPNKEDLLGRSVLHFIHPDDRELVIRRMKDLVAHGDPLPAEKERFIHRDGTTIDGEVKAMQTVYEKKPAVQVIIRDITDRKRLEQQLLQAQKLEGVGTLAGGIAHDFNNLLAMVLGSAELLQRRLLNDPELKKYIDRIIDASERGASISRQLLIFS